MHNNLKNARKKEQLTQQQVAIGAKITVRSYQRIEKGEQDPKTKTSILIAKALNTTVEKLFPLSNIQQNNPLNHNTKNNK